MILMNSNKKVLLSGITPSGTLHLGNYFGAMKQFVDLQNSGEYEMNVFISNYHALISIQDKAKLEELTHNIILDYLAVGLDPKKTTLFLQSDVPELTELTWIFNTLVTVPWLSLAHAYKDKTAKGIEATVGLFDYPVLMSADILLPGAHVVPVGKDQIQHVEMAREIARKFNNAYGETFPEPKAMVQDDVAVVPGTDGQKMSKSYGNTIPLFGSDEEIKKAVMGIVTDSKSPEEPKDPEADNVFALHKLVTPADQLEEIRRGYVEGGLGYGESKKLLLENILKMITPMRERREKFAAKPGLVKKILKRGGKQAKKNAERVMADVRAKTGLITS
jgi:tryptophanyl-tRNA synthetase